MIKQRWCQFFFFSFFPVFFVNFFSNYFPPNQLVLIEPKKLAEDFAAGDFDLFLDDEVEEDLDDGCATFNDAPERGAPACGSTGTSLGRPLRCWPVVATELTGRSGNLTLTELILKQIFMSFLHTRSFKTTFILNVCGTIPH